MLKKDCFAYREKNGHSGCKALNKINCNNCRFYRNDIKESEIERAIRSYTYKKINGGNK